MASIEHRMAALLSRYLERGNLGTGKVTIPASLKRSTAEVLDEYQRSQLRQRD